MLPERGMSKEEIIEALMAMRSDDVRWQDGKAFGLIYNAGPEVHDVIEAVAPLFVHDNALNTLAFPSLAQIQREVVGATASLLHGPESASGFMTSGGTESILMAVKAARDRGRKERGITEPNIVVAESAHAAFHKGAHYFGLEMRKVPVLEDFRADVNAMSEVADTNTVLIAASAPQYPQGVIDPVQEIAALATDLGSNMHVDACMGGFVLPFMEMNGENLPLWDFRVEGVTSISADIHKLGYAPKGASVILHRTRELRKYQTFTFDGWLGGFYASPNMQGTRAGLPMALAWAVMHALGTNGYRRLVAETIEARQKMVDGIREIDGLTVLGEPQAQIAAIATEPGFENLVDIFAIGDAMAERGWFHDRQGPPDSLHATVSAGNVGVIDNYLDDLRDSVAVALGMRAADRSTSYATID